MGIEQHFPDDARNLIHIRSRDLLESLGISVLRQITADVLCGINVRSATEMLTKRRINLLNGAILSTYVNLYESGIDAVDIASMAHGPRTLPGGDSGRRRARAARRRAVLIPSRAR